MKKILLLLLALLCGCLTSQTGEQRVDLRKVHQGVDLAERRFLNAAALYEATDPELFEQFTELGSMLAVLDAELERAIAAGDGAPDAAAFLDQALEAAAWLALNYTNPDPDEQQRVRLIGMGLQTALDLAKIALTPNPPIAP